MARYLIAYGATAVAFFTIDFIWLSRVARQFYLERLGDLLLEKPHMVAAGAFYAVYVAGIVFFAINPAFRAGSAATAAIYGALFGFFAYATYDMTNFATLKNWSLTVSIVDIAWGTVLTGVSAWLGYLATRAILH